MKAIEEFIKDIEGSADLQNDIKNIKDQDALAEFLKKNDVEGTAEDFVKAVKAKRSAEGSLPDESVDAVAGGVQAGDIFRPIYELPKPIKRLEYL